MNRTTSVLLGIVLGAVSGAILATAATANVATMLGADLAWFAPYFRLLGIAIGGAFLAAALVIIGLGVGRWRRPTPSYRRRGDLRF
jgi:hypothetical protein